MVECCKSNNASINESDFLAPSQMFCDDESLWSLFLVFALTSEWALSSYIYFNNEALKPSKARFTSRDNKKYIFV